MEVWKKPLFKTPKSSCAATEGLARDEYEKKTEENKKEN